MRVSSSVDSINRARFVSVASAASACIGDNSPAASASTTRRPRSEAWYANFILLADKERIQSDAAIGFNLRHWQKVRFYDTLDLKWKLVAALEARFRLGSGG